ncbi:hypothetical protein N2152v2_000008 [Parachlorella kessleri]
MATAVPSQDTSNRQVGDLDAGAAAAVAVQHRAEARVQELQLQLEQAQRQLATLQQSITQLDLDKQQLQLTNNKLQQQATNISVVCQRDKRDLEQLLAHYQRAEVATRNSSSSSGGSLATWSQDELRLCQEEKQRQEQLVKKAEEQSKDRQKELAGCEDDQRIAAEADRHQLDALLKSWPQILAARRGVIAQQPRRGIVTLAARGSLVANAFVNLYVLRHHLHCSLPVVITFHGAKESVAAATQAFFDEHIPDVKFYDTSRPPYPAHQRLLLREQAQGWKLKVLYLDSDCMPLYDPSVLFETPEYQQHGVIIFPDRPGEAPPLYKHYGLHNPWVNNPTLSQAETGMLLLNRTEHADVLEYLLFLNVHDEFTYRVTYGDKDTFRAAFDLAGKRDFFYQSPHRLSLALTETQQNPGHFAWRGFVQMAPNGSVAFIHRAWFTKYNPEDDTLRNFTHMTVGLSPQRAMTNFMFPRDFPPSEVTPVPAEQCQLDPLDRPGSEQRCGFVSSDTSLPIPAIAVPQGSPVARALKATDEAFLLLRGAMRTKKDLLG